MMETPVARARRIDEPRRYIDKTREYYRGEGYDTPYRWAHFDDSRSPGRRPASGMTTRACNVYALPTATPVGALYSKKESYDRRATTLDDVDSCLPLTRLAECV